MNNALSTDVQRTTKKAVEDKAGTTGRKGGKMISNVPRFVTQARASYLLGIAEAELRRISKESGLGHVERAGDEEETYFTYEELRQALLLALSEKQIRN